MFPQDTGHMAGGAVPRCADCNGCLTHMDTCPQRRALLDLFDADMAGLAARNGRPFTRPMHQVERDHLGSAGCPIARRDRHRWRVRVHADGADAVRREIRRAGHLVAEFIDEPVPAATVRGAR